MSISVCCLLTLEKCYNFCGRKTATVLLYRICAWQLVICGSERKLVICGSEHNFTNIIMVSVKIISVSRVPVMRKTSLGLRQGQGQGH